MTPRQTQPERTGGGRGRFNRRGGRAQAVGLAVLWAVAFASACSDEKPAGQEQYSLTVVSSGGGVIQSDPAGIDCRSDCLLSSVIYPVGTQVVLTATPDSGRLFSGWSGDCSGTGPCALTLTADKSVMATFTTTSYPLVVTLAGTGGGNVSSSPAGIDCSMNGAPGCTKIYPHATVVTLTATPDMYSEFAGWSGACEGTAPTCTLTMDRAKGATATFNKRRVAVTVELAGTGVGTVVSTPDGINCGTTCMATFSAGTMLTLHPAADPTATFQGWSGACSGMADCTLLVDQELRATATFEKITYLVSVSRNRAGTVTSAPAGIACGDTCSAPFDINSMVTLTATPDATSHFAGWSGHCMGTADCVLTMDGPKAVAARFTYPLTVRRVGTGGGGVKSMPMGIDCGASCTSEFDPDEMVTLTATPDTNSTFISWAGACDGSEPACVVTMTEAKTVSATFTKKIFPVVVNRAGTGGGTVRSAPMGIDCGSDCAASFDSGTQITLTATPDATSTFAGWSGACAGTSTCSLLIDRVRFVTATFTRIQYPLTVNRTGSGTVTSDPLGLFCGSVCTASFDIGARVSLTAVADTGASFTGWGGACSGTGPCVVTMSAATTVQATFARTNYTLTLNRLGTGNGNVTSVPPGINCGGGATACSASYQVGTLVTLTAQPDSSSTFAGWSGACTGNQLCVITLNDNATVNATFTRQSLLVTVNRQGTGAGTVTSSPIGIDCGATCAASFPSGTALTLAAIPDSSSTFVGWSGACQGTGSCSLQVTETTFVTATFARIRYALTATVPQGGGTILSDPFGIFCGPLCSASYDSGVVVTLTAMPEATATFAGWTGACTGTGPCVVTMDGAKSVTASFTFRLTVNKVSQGGGDGLITSSLAGINCGATCAAEFPPSAVVTLTAAPSSTSLFAGWSGACSGTNACVVTMDAAKGVTATFTSNLFALTVNRTGTGQGTVVSTPAGISCGNACTASYLNGQQVTLTASPASNSVFAGWSGACLGTGNCLVTVDGVKSVTATFTRVVYNLAVSTGSGGGTVTSSPSGIYCGAVCSADFDSNSVVTLAASPDVTATFAGWSGACTGTGDCVVTMDAAKTVTARFTFRLTVTKAGTGTGTIVSTPSGISCGASCGADYNRATVITLNASPDAGSSFTGWSGACGGTGTCTVAMDAAKTVSATFTRGIFQLTVTTTGNGGGTIVSNPAGINCGPNCVASFDASQQVTLTATPDSNSTFTGWSGACGGTGTCSVSMDAARTVTATFTKKRFTLTVTRTGSGTVTSDTGGIFCGAACAGTYDSGTVVTLTASPDPTASFTGWSGACAGTGACAVTVDANKTVGATFTTNTFALTVTKAGTGAGSVTSTPAGVDCGATCTFSYDSGTVVTLTATPTAISTFTGWSGACTGVGACTLTMTAARAVTATFDKSRFALTVSRTGTGGGLVQSNPAGIDCGATCQGSYDGGTLVSLSATADANSQFAGWSGACTGTGACSVTMDAAKSVTATFAKRTFAITLTRTGAGTVTSDPLGLYCGASCSASFDSGATVTLTASPDPSASFVGWGGACAGTGTCILTMNSNKTVTATFSTNTFALSVSLAGAGSGTVSSTPAGIACGNTCSATYDSGTVVTLTATPGSTSQFTGWSGACTGAGVCTLTMNAAKTVTATFALNQYELLVNLTGTGGGSVSSSPVGIDCGIDCSNFYDGGQVVALTATPDANSTFAGWSGACAGSGACSVTMDASKTATATFAHKTYVLTMNLVGSGGVVTSDPAGIYCGAACSASFASGSFVTLTATPDSATTFGGWSGACAGTASCTLTMDAAKTVTATFVTNTYQLTVTKAGAGAGTVTSTPAGINCGASCTSGFAANTVVTLTAAPDGISNFTGWSGACVGSGVCTVTMSGATAVTATFAKSQFAVSVAKTGSGGGTVTSAPAGIACGANCTASFDGGTALTLSASADASSTFVGWSGSCAGSATTCSLTVDGVKSVTATFAKNTFALTLTRVGSGTVTSTPAGIYCGAACSASFDSGSIVTLTATADASATFTGWSGACTGATSSCSVTMDAAKSVTATFTTNVFALTVARTGSGVGNVTSTPAGIDCGTTCSASYNSGTVVTLSATPSSSSAFGGWSGACTGVGACTLTMSQAQSVTATFTLGNFPLTVSKTGTGTGTVTSSPAGISCGATCSAAYPAGTVVTLTAVADGTATFTGWTGACTGTGACSVTVDAAKSVGASFSAFTYDLSVNVGTGGGTVVSTPAGIYCGVTCGQSFNAGDMVTLTATPNPGATFTGWTGACTGTGTCTLTMNGAKSVGANFVFPLAVATSGTGGGAITSTPAGINCGTTCSATYANQTSVTLVATPDATSIFAGWTGACSGNLTCTVTMTNAVSVTATFTRATYALTVAKGGTGTGTVTSAPSGITCGATCSAVYQAATVVSLTASADANSQFTGWSGACSGAAACSVTMDAGKSVTATFTKLAYTLTVTRAGTGGGLVTSSPLSIYCGSTCSASFDSGTTLILSAAPDGRSSFTGWSGACTGTTDCSLTITAATNVTATFQTNQFALSVNRAGTGSGVVASTPAGINCGTSCNTSYDSGTQVTLTATPSGNSTFAGWTGDCGGAGNCVLTMSQARSVTATFTKSTYALTVAKTGSGDGTITSTPAPGLSCGATCSVVYDAGTAVTISAAPDANSTFTGWSGACAGTADCTLTMDSQKSVTATFTKNFYTVTVSRTGAGTVTSSPLAIYCGATCSASFASGSTVTLSATPDASASFAGWGGACTGTGVCTLTITAATNVTATFTTNTYALTVATAGTGGGSVSSSPAGISCGATCSASYSSGTLVTLTATPNSTSIFTGWSGACSGTGQCLLNMDAPKSVTATFAPNNFTLTVTLNGSGGGTVASSPPGIACGTTCSASYNAGTLVTLTATPDANSSFTGWSGACLGTSPCTVTMDQARGAAATFTKNQYTLTVTRTGNGTITSSPLAIYCGSTCAATFDSGSSVSLTATPDRGATFTGWSGACAGTGSCVVTMGGARTVGATFVTNQYTLTVSRAGAGGGSVSSSPAGISCGATCSFNWDAGTLVTLSATPDSASIFSGWSGACSGTGQCLLSMDAAKSVVATFVPNTFALTVSLNGNGLGTVTSNPAGIACGPTCSASYNAGTVIALSATADVTSTFTGWSGACVGTGPCSVTLTSAQNVAATFTRKTYAVTLTRTGGGTITSSPIGIYCGATCAASFDAGTSVTLTAAADPGATFVGWSGDCTGTSTTCTLSIDAAKNAGARFSFPLTVSVSGTGGGTVSSTPVGINACAGTCTASFDGASVVTLTPTADSTSSFTAWQGACVGTGACSVTMDAAKNVIASFSRTNFTLTVAKTGTGGGTVSDGAALSCGTTCTASYTVNTNVTLTATPDATSTFAGWSGACSGTTPTCAITMNSAKTATATFTRIQYALTVTRTVGGSVTSTPLGIFCGAACSAIFDAGTQVTLSPSPDSSATFAGWSGACTGNGSCVVTMDGAKSVSAVFTFPLVVNKNGNGSGVVTSSVSGINCGPTCTATYDGGTPLTLTASPSPNSTFAGWSGPCGGTGSCVLTMDASKFVTATFTTNTVSLAVTRNGNGDGRVTSSPPGVDCGASCVGQFDVGTVVSLTATPSANSLFAGWSGACTGSGACTLTMNAPQSVTATFQLQVYSVTVSRTGSGLVTSSPPSIYCGSACSAPFNGGTTVTLTATPDPGGTFVGWGGGACSGTGTCTLSVTAAQNVTATFNNPLTVSKTGTGDGTIVSTPSGINCGSQCQNAYAPGTVVTLTASPNSASSFAGWSGACGGLGTCSVTMDGSKSVTATFLRQQFYVFVGRDGNGVGTVTSNPPGISCGSTCAARFDGGSTITLTAVAAQFSTFTGWTGACSGTGACTISNIAADTSVVATFSKPKFTLTTSRTGSGTVLSSPAGILCPPQCSFLQDAGTIVSLTPVPDPGSSFGDWSGACSGSATSCSVTLDADKSVLARFGFSLTVTRTGGGGGSVAASIPAGSGPNGFDCSTTGSSCSFVYDPGAVVTLTATPDAGGQFVGWSGDCASAGTATTCTITMSQAHAVGATFNLPLHVTRYNDGGGSVTSVPAGITCDGVGPCNTFFAYGTQVTLTATPATNNAFAGWTGCDSTNGAQCMVTINGQKNVQARFTVPVTTNRVAASMGTITGPGGLNCGAVCTVYYNYGDPQVFVASPDATQSFGLASWTGCDSVSGNQCTVTPLSQRTVTATFSNNVIVNISGGSSSGTVTSSPAGINCGTTCAANFASGSTVDLTPTNGAGTNFRTWTGCDQIVGNVCRLTMNANKNVTAIFTYPLTVSLTGGGGGFVTAPAINGTTVNCGAGPCVYSSDVGAVITLTATPDSTLSAQFGGWTGCDSVSGAQCTVTMNAAKSVRATFTVPLAVSTTSGSSPAGSGSFDAPNASSFVYPNPPGGTGTCPDALRGSDCSGYHEFGNTVTLRANPDANSIFVSWSGCPQPSGLTCTVPMTAQRSVQARFDVQRFGVTVNIAQENTGTVPSAQNGTGSVSTTTMTPGAPYNTSSLSCASSTTSASSCGQTFVRNSLIKLTASSGADSSFASWSGCDSTEGVAGNVCVISNTAGDGVSALPNRTVTPVFYRVYRTLSVAVQALALGTATGDGVVTASPAGIPALNCGSALSQSSCASSFIINTGVTLTATPQDASSKVASWTGCTVNAGNPNQCTITMAASAMVTVRFDANCADSSSGGASCGAATDLGTVSVGGSLQRSGNLRQPGEEEWFLVRFPAVAGGARGGTPSIALATDQTGPFRIEIRDSACANPARSCGGVAGAPDSCATPTGTASNITAFSMSDPFTVCDQPNVSCPAGTTAYRTTCVTPWPDTTYVRVYRASAAGALCDTYTLNITR